MAKRPFEQVSVDVTGVQSFNDRFGKRRRYDDGTPPVAQWRSNLTGLSQVHNLFFVAYGQDIHVYIPHFPTQAIAEKPTLVFSSQPSSLGLRGYIDARRPHAINTLLVRGLGHEEVVAVVRDNGDVDAFLVRHVLQAIERRAEGDNAIGVVADEIRPIFQDNVESSAWGLAIHSEARILATSSNKHEVRIFKFGLIGNDDRSSDDEDAECRPQSRDERNSGPKASASRREDVTLHVVNGNSNIPYIAFCNTGDDPEGRWLLTTDIGGVCRVIDLRKSEYNQTFRFGPPSASGSVAGGFDRINAGWTVAFLDRRAFQPELCTETALGVEAEARSQNTYEDSGVWDISQTIKRVPNAAEPFVYHKPRKRTASERPLATARSVSGQSLTSSTTESQDTSTRPSTASDAAESSVEIEIDIAGGDMDSEDEDGGVDIEIDHDTADEEDQDDAVTIAPTAESADVPATVSSDEEEEDTWHVNLVDDNDDPDDEGTEDTTAFTAYYGGASVSANAPLFARTEPDGATTTLCDDLPCPILHTSVRNIYLLQPSDREAAAPSACGAPMVGLANPLRQPIQVEFEYLRLFERLNMVAQIPELGVVVVASQKGRALVLGLTKVGGGAADAAAAAAGKKGKGCKKSTYAMRVECILPFAGQERENQRPFAPLHGLAVGPMQGFQGKRVRGERRRWRVLLMYQDHSILSYEISRKRADDGDAGVDVEGLVV